MLAVEPCSLPTVDVDARIFQPGIAGRFFCVNRNAVKRGARGRASPLKSQHRSLLQGHRLASASSVSPEYSSLLIERSTQKFVVRQFSVFYRAIWENTVLSSDTCCNSTVNPSARTYGTIRVDPSADHLSLVEEVRWTYTPYSYGLQFCVSRMVSD
jgi:hypothetical protein